MLSRPLGVVVVVLAFANQTPGFEVGAVIQKIDAERRVALVFANGKERTVKIADDAKILAEDGKNLPGGLGAKELKVGTTVSLRVERDGGDMAIVAIRLGGMVHSAVGLNVSGRISVGRTSVGFQPLTEMAAEDRYKGEDGGLYGGGRNEPPESHNSAAKRETARIQPLDADGNPAADGKIGLVSISMSNATQEFSRFKQLADADPEKSRLVRVVDCAQGGQTIARWADSRAACWTEADRRLAASRVTCQQVQVAWAKLANAGPSGELAEHGKQLERDTRSVLSNLKEYFPNLRIAYLGSRIYGGYADGRLNPEPYAYEGAFVVRWLIQSQIRGDAGLNYVPERGQVNAPLLLWGPYFWADGMTPRKSDGLIWERSDLAGDGTHPTGTGRQKVAEQLLSFFKTDVHAKTWFVENKKSLRGRP